MNMDINVTNKLLPWISYVYVLNYTIAGVFIYNIENKYPKLNFLFVIQVQRSASFLSEFQTFDVWQF